MPTLYEICQSAQKLRELSETTDDSESMQIIEDAIDLNDADLAAKLDSCAAVIAELNHECTALEAEEKRMAMRRRGIIANISRIKNRMLEAMVTTGLDKARGKFTVSVSTTTPRVEVMDEDEIPEQYWIPQPPKLDKRNVLEALKAGRQVSGAQIATSSTVRIR